MDVQKIFKVYRYRKFRRLFSSSSLFISDRSTRERPIFTPTPDLENKFKNVNELQENLKARNLNMDAIALKGIWEMHNELKSVRTTLEQRRIDIAEQMKNLRKISQSEGKDSMEKLRLEGRIVREDLKELLKTFWEVEEKMMASCLLLPNDLHPKTPLMNDEVYEEHIVNTLHGNSHLEASDLIDYRGPSCYYLKKDAALFDMALQDYFRCGFNSAGFIGMQGPDFAHAAVIEACGSATQSHAQLEPLKDNFHLIGSSSLFSLCTFYAKQCIPAENLPIRNFAVGRNYTSRDGPGLFGVWQRNKVDFVSISANPIDLEAEFEAISSLVTSLYKNLGWTYRVVYCSAASLSARESLRLSFQMYSSSLQQWVETGNISIIGSFISERMSLIHERKDRSKDFCQLVSGTAVDATSVLACLLEEQNRNLFPTQLSPYLVA